MGSKYTYQVVRGTEVCSEHTSKALAEKAAGRLQAMSKGKLPIGTFTVTEIGTEQAGADIRYHEYRKMLEAIEARTGLYLSDECVDRENAGSDANPEFWNLMLASAVSAAWFRAEDAGQDPRALGLVSP